MNNRVINNHKKLSKVIDNFNDYFQDEYENNILICILDKINNLNIDENTKYQLSLENISNILDTNDIYYNQDIFVESVTDYFLYNNLYNDDMINILEKVSLKKKPNLSKVKEYINSFPKEKIKGKSDIKNIIRKFYVLSKDNIVEETPNMLIWIRKGIIYSTLAVNVYLGALTIFIDYFISMNIRREDVKKMKKKLESERDLIEKKIDKVSNEKKRDELEKYLKEIEKAIDSVEIYEESLYSEKELEERDEEEMNFESTELITINEGAAIQKLKQFVKKFVMSKEEKNIQSFKNMFPPGELGIIVEDIEKEFRGYKVLTKKHEEYDFVINRVKNSDIDKNWTYRTVNFTKDNKEVTFTEEEYPGERIIRLLITNGKKVLCYPIYDSTNEYDIVYIKLDKTYKKIKESGEIIEDEIYNLNPLKDKCFSKEEYYKCHHVNFIAEIDRVVRNVENICNHRIDLKRLKQERVISISTEDEFVQFIEMDHISMEDYMDANNRISYCILQLLPYNSEDLHINDLNELANNLCQELDKITDEDVVVHFDGNDDVINIFVTLSIPVYDAVRENTMHIEMKKDLAYILALEEQVKLLQEKFKEVDTGYLEESILEEDEINFITEFALETDIIDKDIVIESFKNMKDELYKQDSLDKFIKGSILQESIYQLSNKKKENILRPKNRYQVLAETICLNESLSIVNEISVANNLKLAKDNLAKNIKKMSDKEKITSRTLDNALDKFYNTIEKELTNKNREKVIKGTVLPSASTIVKIALTSGAVAFINPALSVITVLGSLAVSKRATAKEKQYILDEINIMLKVCEKKIQLAESNNDMKALEQLLRTQQKLERERQRIKYNLRRRNHPVSSY